MLGLDRAQLQDWYLERAVRLASRRTSSVRAVLERLDCDLLCVTEGYAGNLPSSGHSITSDADYGYNVNDGRRKVLLWSRLPLA